MATKKLFLNGRSVMADGAAHRGLACDARGACPRPAFHTPPSNTGVNVGLPSCEMVVAS